MSSLLVDNLEKIKANGSLSNSAKLLAGLMAATGISDAKQIADMLGINLRTVRRLKLDVASAIDVDASATGGSANSANSAIYGSANSANSATGGTDQRTDKKVSPTPLSKNNIITTTVHHAEREDGRTDDYADCKAAFNGSTEAMLAIIEAAMGGNCRPNAAQWLANLVRINGQQAVAEAYQKFLTARAEGSIIARPLPWLDTTAKTCKRDAAKATSKPKITGEPEGISIAAITEGAKRFMKPAPGSARTPELDHA